MIPAFLIPIICDLAPTAFKFLANGKINKTKEALQDGFGLDDIDKVAGVIQDVITNVRTNDRADRRSALDIIKADPAYLAKFEAAEKSAQVKEQELTKRILGDIDLTKSLVNVSDKIVKWARPINLWAFALESFALVVGGVIGLFLHLFKAVAFDFTTYTTFITAIMPLFMLQAAVGGVYVYHRSKEKQHHNDLQKHLSGGAESNTPPIATQLGEAMMSGDVKGFTTALLAACDDFKAKFGDNVIKDLLTALTPAKRRK